MREMIVRVRGERVEIDGREMRPDRAVALAMDLYAAAMAALRAQQEARDVTP